MPLREFYGHPFRAVDEHQLSATETARGDVGRIVPIRAEARELRRGLDDIATDLKPKKP